MTSALGRRLGEGAVRRLSERAAQLVREWALRPAGEALDDGSWAYLLPCEDRRGRDLVLKVSAAYATAAREARTLEAWRGSPAAATLVRHAPDALLLEHVRPGAAFTGAESGARRAIASLLAQLHAASGHTKPRPGPFVPHELDLVPVLDRIGERLRAHVSRERLERALEDAAATVRTIRDARLIHGDVSPGNVLAGRGMLVAVDPAGVLGEPEYDAAGAALYFDFGGDPADRALGLARLLDLDEARTLRWARLHALQSASYAVALGGESGAEWAAERLRFALSA